MVTIPFLTKRRVRPTAADLELLLLTDDVEPPRKLEDLDEERRPNGQNMQSQFMGASKTLPFLLSERDVLPLGSFKI